MLPNQKTFKLVNFVEKFSKKYELSFYVQWKHFLEWLDSVLCDVYKLFSTKISLLRIGHFLQNVSEKRLDFFNSCSD